MKTIGIIALSGVVNKKKLGAAVTNLEQLGFNVKLSNNIYDNNRYLAGNDGDKLEELHRFFSDPQIDIIMAARGGYGAIRLIDRIDYDLIKNNPKPFIGFSDVTALLLMIYKKTGIITYHGPMACSDFSEVLEPHPLPPSLKERGESFTLKEFFKALSGETLEYCGNKVYKQGSACGIIWGGNLATVVSLCGQDFIPDEDFVFFAEDLNEPVYKIDRMFTQLFNIEKFKTNCKGIVLGDFLEIDNQEWLEELFTEFTIPTVGGFQITHLKDKITLPIGSKCALNNDRLIVN